MNNDELTLEEVIMNFLLDKGQKIYFADEDAVWVIRNLRFNKDNTSGYAFRATVDSVWCNGERGDGNSYRYDDGEDLIFTKVDLDVLGIKFFTDESKAYEEQGYKSIYKDLQKLTIVLLAV